MDDKKFLLYTKGMVAKLVLQVNSGLPTMFLLLGVLSWIDSVTDYLLKTEGLPEGKVSVNTCLKWMLNYEAEMGNTMPLNDRIYFMDQLQDVMEDDPEGITSELQQAIDKFINEKDLSLFEDTLQEVLDDSKME